jgi:hypothetical protein
MISSIRIFLPPERLRLRASIVALLVGVMPIISNPSSLQANCSCQVYFERA